jgi:hypothetical protein
MNTPSRALVLIAMMLLVAASLCAFDDEAMGTDLCGLVLLPAVGLVVMGPRPLAGRVGPVRMQLHPGDPLDRPFPPPRA